MTRVFGFALDAESGAALVGCEVVAQINPRGSTVPPITSGTDRFVTGADGRWELNLPPTAGSGLTIKIREWLNRTFFIDVPTAPIGDAAINVQELIVDPDGTLPPDPESLFVTRAELGEPDGVAQLGGDGKLKFEQRPPGGGSGGTDPDPVVDWFHGFGAPSGTIVGAGLGDMYVDMNTGLLYQLR
jgi:hypothetical protein